MSIRTDKKNSSVFVVDTLTDLLELLAKQNIRVKISDTSELRYMDVEESFDEDEK